MSLLVRCALYDQKVVLALMKRALFGKCVEGGCVKGELEE